MEASELRIGNYLKDNEIGFKDEFQVKAGDILQIQNKEENEYSYITLTEEWLIKLGFVYRNESRGLYAILDLKLEDYSEWKNSLSGGFVKDNGGGFHVMNCPTCRNLRYVHELQNLYFALTGKELEIIK